MNKIERKIGNDLYVFEPNCEFSPTEGKNQGNVYHFHSMQRRRGGKMIGMKMYTFPLEHQEDVAQFLIDVGNMILGQEEEDIPF